LPVWRPSRQFSEKNVRYQPVVKVDSRSLFKKTAGKAREKVKAEAYLTCAKV